MDYNSLIRREILEITPYVPGKPIEEVQRELGIKDVIKMASNENPLGPSPQAVRVIGEAAARAHIYPDGNCYYLKEALSESLGVKTDQLIIGNGSDEIIKLFAEAFFRPGDEVIVADPTFGEYAYAAHLMGAKVVKVKSDKGLGHNLPQMAEAVTERTKAIFVCNPNNPTGTMNTREEWETLLKEVPPHVLIVSDQAYLEYTDDPSYPDGVEYINDERVLVLRTFSKIYGLAGLRIGYGVGSSGLIASLNRVREPFNVNLVAQAAAIASLSDQEHVVRSREVNKRGKSQLYRGLRELGLEYLPSQTNFILFETPYPSKDVFQALLKRGVIVRTADIFGLSRHIRVTIGKEEENERFLHSLREVLSRLQNGN